MGKIVATITGHELAADGTLSVYFNAERADGETVTPLTGQQINVTTTDPAAVNQAVKTQAHQMFGEEDGDSKMVLNGFA